MPIEMNNMDVDKIKSLLHECFDVIQDKCADLIILQKNTQKKLAYVLVKTGVSNKFLISKNEKSLLDQVINVEKLPIVIFTMLGDDIIFGILVYWHFNQYFYNKNITWRILNTQNLEWLKVALNAQRRDIRFLPKHMFRIEKIISLNSSSLLNGEIRYLRTFEDGYKMKKNTTTKGNEFDRFLYGIPENEYPNDVLDDTIFQAVKGVYPNASVKSKLILFETDIIDLTYLKDRRIETLKIYAISEKESILIPIADLDVLYTPNVWKGKEEIRNVSVKIRFQTSEDLKCIRTRINRVYEPISKINL